MQHKFNCASVRPSCGASRTSTLQTVMSQLLPTIASWRLTMRELDHRRPLSAPSFLTWTRSRTFSIWTAGGHLSVNWLHCMQTGETSTTTRRLCLEKPNGSDVLRGLQSDEAEGFGIVTVTKMRCINKTYEHSYFKPFTLFRMTGFHLCVNHV